MCINMYAIHQAKVAHFATNIQSSKFQPTLKLLNWVCAVFFSSSTLVQGVK
jgi:hypothetical protein